MDWLMFAVGALLVGVPAGFVLCALCTAAARADKTSPSTATAAAPPAGPSDGSVDGSVPLPGAAVDGEDIEALGVAPPKAMAAILAAGARVRNDDGISFRWLAGAPTHVLAELLTELRADGWVLRRANTSPGGAGVPPRPPSGAPEPPISHGGHAPSGGDTTAHDLVRDTLLEADVAMPGVLASAVLARLVGNDYVILTRSDAERLTGIGS